MEVKKIEIPCSKCDNAWIPIEVHSAHSEHLTKDDYLFICEKCTDNDQMYFELTEKAQEKLLEKFMDSLE